MVETLSDVFTSVMTAGSILGLAVLVVAWYELIESLVIKVRN